MKIGQLAKEVGITTATIRFYEQQKIMNAPERLPNGYRNYDESHVRRLQLIKFCQSLGFSLQELPSMFSAEQVIHDVAFEQLKKKRTELNDLINQLEAKKAQVEQLISLTEPHWEKGECLPEEVLDDIF